MNYKHWTTFLKLIRVWNTLITVLIISPGILFLDWQKSYVAKHPRWRLGIVLSNGSCQFTTINFQHKFAFHYSDVIMGAMASRITTGLCTGNSLVTGEFPGKMAGNMENASIWCRHYVAECRIPCTNSYYLVQLVWSLFIWHHLNLINQTCFD